jgi:putative glutathione S-transferase
MGTLVNGSWRRDVEAQSFDDGRFVRDEAQLRNWIDADGAHPPEAGRYHLYIFAGCPWAHRTWLMHQLKGLDEVVGISMVSRMSADGWMFDPDSDDHRDRLHGRAFLHEVYAAGAPGYTGRCTVPVLWDEHTQAIVNNESSEIIRMLDSAFGGLAKNQVDFYPEDLRDEIDELNARIFADFNNGVYRAGFAQTSEAHAEAKSDVFALLDFLDERLAERRFLCGDRFTEADVRLFPTVARFDAAYVSAFGCDLKRLADYSNVSRYARDVYEQPGVAATVMPPAYYSRGYHSIPIAVGHSDAPPPSPERHAFEPATVAEATA